MIIIGAIKTYIQLMDGMSPVLKSITSSMNTVINHCETMNGASKNMMDTSSLKIARDQLSQADAALRGMEESIQAAQSRQEQFNASMRGGQSAADGLVKKIGGIVAAYATLQTGEKVMGLSDTMSQTTARLNMMNDGLQTTRDLQDMIFLSAQRTHGSYLDTADAVAKLGVMASDAFSSNAEVVGFMEQINKHFAIAGTSAEGISAAMLQLTQAMGSGVLRGEEYNSILEQAPNIIEDIAKYMDVPKGKLKEMAAEGEITADIVKKAMFAAADETDKKFQSIPMTWGKLFENAKNQIIRSFEPVLQKISDLAQSEQLQNIINYVIGGLVMAASAVLDLMENLSRLAANTTFQQIIENIITAVMILGSVVMSAFQGMVSLAVWLMNTWGIVGPFIIGAAIAIGAVVAALMIYNTVQAISNGLQIISAARSALKAGLSLTEAAATKTATGAQVGLNAALLACPITWIILAIIALIAAFYAVIGAINKFAGTSLSATGIVFGAFSSLGAVILNIFIKIWNFIAIFVEFFANVFNHPVYAIKKLFVSLANKILDCIILMTRGWDEFATRMANAFIDAVNFVIRAWNKLIDLLPDNVVSFLHIGKGTEIQHTQSITTTLENAKSGLNDWLGEEPEDYRNVKTFDTINLSDAWNWGYGKGEALGNKFSDWRDAFKIDDKIGEAKDKLGLNGLGIAGGIGEDAADLMSKDALTNAIDDTIASNIGQTAENTKKISDVNEDYLKYLKIIAERQAINEFTTAEVKVEMNNSNYLSKDADIDGIINQLGTKLGEQLAVVAEGVHV